MTDRDLLELIANQVGKLTTQVDSMDSRVGKLTSDIDETKEEMRAGFKHLENEINRIRGTVSKIENDIRSVRGTVSKIEVDHGQKLGALFDGYKLVSGKIDKIEKEVTKHEEIILRAQK